MTDSQYAYAYFSSCDALYRVKIPKISPCCKHEFMVELVFPQLPLSPALFNHNHIVYAVGGSEGSTFVYSRAMYIFDPSRFHQLPIENLRCLDDKPRDFESMVDARVIRGVGDQIYLFSVNNDLYQPMFNKEQFCCFQSFDPIKDCFETLPSPPLAPLAPDHVISLTVTFGHFFLSGHIYLFIRDPLSKYPESVFSFNIRFKKWEERMSLLDRFHKKQIPPPFEHTGDIGLSDEFFDKTRILVAFCHTTLSAYRVKIHADGDLEPISYRELKESCYQEGWHHFITYPLADIGGGKFFVVADSYKVGLLMYVFQIDFTLEHHIQSSASGVGSSSRILYYKKFQRGYAIDCFCIASAPLTIEDQDRVEKSRRERSGDETMYKSKILRSL